MSAKIKFIPLLMASVMTVGCGGADNSSNDQDKNGGNTPGNVSDNGSGNNGNTSGNGNNGSGATAKPSLLFTATGDINKGAELWITDGSADGTRQVKNIHEAGDGAPTHFTKVGNRWFFSADSDASGRELWVTDGTEAGTRLVKDIHETGDSNPSQLVALADKLIFSATNGINGMELWISDGTADGTKMLKDIYSGSPSPGIKYATYFNNKVYFAARDRSSLGDELWETDGTTDGTKITLRISSGKVPHINQYEGSIPSQLVASNGRLYFTAKNNTRQSREQPVNMESHTVMLDGSVVSIGDLRPGALGSFPASYTEVKFSSGTATVFTATQGMGSEIWMHSGNSRTRLTNFNNSAARPGFLTAAGNKLFFAAQTPTQGYELMVSEGTAASTKVVKDISPGQHGSYIRNITPLADKVIFVAHKAASKVAVRPVKTKEKAARLAIRTTDSLWVSDGSEAGTSEILTLEKGTSLKQFIPFAGKILFSADNGINGQELWITDGTKDGTRLLKDIRNGSDSSNPTFIQNPVNGPEV